MGLGAILTAIVTPFDADGRVDDDAFVALMRHLAANGSDGFVVLGSTGEAATLDDDEHLALIRLACEERPDGTTIVGGTGSNDTRHAARLTERACALGVDAVLSVTPYYNKPNPRGIRAHYEAVSAASSVPIVLYNIPSRVVVDIPNDELARLAELEHVDYVKQANPDDLALVDGLGLYAGNDEDLARTLDLGGVGGICVASHLVGDHFQRMVRADPDERARIHASLSPLFAAMGVTTNPMPVKEALAMLGHRVGGFRLPMVELDDRERAVVRDALAGLGLLERVA